MPVSPSPRRRLLKGDVTTAGAITGHDISQLEKRLGFAAGRLAQGFALFALDDVIHPGDFTWGDQTRFSGAWKFSQAVSEQLAAAGMYEFSPEAKAGDLARAGFARKHGPEAGDYQYALFMAREADRLAVRAGPGAIVKLVPEIGHDRSVDSRTQYPDAKALGVLQWTLQRPKWFNYLTHVAPGVKVELV